MSLPAGWGWADLTSADDPLFPDFFAVYQESMPVREQKPRSALEALAGRSDYRIRLLRTMPGPAAEVLGYSVTFAPGDEDLRLLEYMAVRRDRRDQGLGGLLFRDAFAGLEDPGCPVHGLLEVDAPRSPAPDLAVREARWRFYARQGCRRLAGLAYQLPLPGEGAPPAMDLAVYRPGMPAAVPKTQVRRWLEAIYRRVYGQAATDPRIDQMLDPLDDQVPLVSV